MVSERESPGPARGLVSWLPDRAGQRMEHHRVLPSEPLAPFIAHYWWVRWDLATPRRAETIPHPCLHWVLETPGPRAEAVGVQRRRFTRVLEGRGSVFGIKFRPAVYRTFFACAPHALTDRRAPLPDRPAVRALLATIPAGLALERTAAAIDQALAQGLPDLPADVRGLRDLVERLEHDQTIVRVDQVAQQLRLPVRTLERRFRQHVGVSPKWVIRRYRLIEAVELLKRASAGELAAIAARLGYSDQAHFTRDVKALTGRPPGAFIT